MPPSASATVASTCRRARPRGLTRDSQPIAKGETVITGQAVEQAHDNAHYDGLMDISVTRFRALCLELIRQVESGGEVVEITRHGKTVARLIPPAGTSASAQKP